MKGWGKSPPRTWRQGRHGKPRQEQDRIGIPRPARGRAVIGLRRPGRSREPSSNGRSRGMIVAPVRGRHRTRLIGRLVRTSVPLIHRRPQTRRLYLTSSLYVLLISTVDACDVTVSSLRFPEITAWSHCLPIDPMLTQSASVEDQRRVGAGGFAGPKRGEVGGSLGAAIWGAAGCFSRPSRNK